MERKADGATEIVRLVNKTKSPSWRKSTIVLMSNGLVWEKVTTKAKDGSKIKSSWAIVNRVRDTSKYTKRILVRIFSDGGWKKKACRA